MRPLLALYLIAALAFPVVAGATSHIQPGDLYNEICTLNFVFDGEGALAGKVYIGTAAHCVERVGEPASTPGAAKFGKVVYTGDFDGDGNGVPGVQMDFALIEVFAAFHARVLPDVLGHAGMPTGYTTSETTSTGDLLYISGHGMAVGTLAPTRENRTGVLVSDTSEGFVADTLAVWGDSGGGILHFDGRAMGVVSQYAFGATPPATDEGPTVEGILAEMESLGYPLRLRTAS